MKRKTRCWLATIGPVLVMSSCSAPASADVLTLRDALRLARERSPARRAALARTDAAEARVDLAQTGMQPTLSVSARALGVAARDAFPTRDGTVFVNTNYTGAGDVNAQLRWTLYDFGQTGNATRSAEIASLGARRDVEAFDVTFEQQVAEAYVTVAFQTELLGALTQTIGQRERALTITQNLVKSGVQPPLEEVRVRARLDATRRDLAEAKSTAFSSRARLATILGESAASPPEVVRPKLPPVTVDAAQAERLAEAARPEVRRDQLLAQSFEAAVDAARARRRPTLAFAADAFYRLAQRDEPAVQLRTGNAQGALVLSLPILDFSIGARVDLARAQAAEAVAQYEQRRRDTRESGARSSIEARLTAERVEEAKRAEADAKNLLDRAQDRYQTGLTSSLEMLDAEATETVARIERLRAELDLALATVRYLGATGQLAKLVDQR